MPRVVPRPWVYFIQDVRTKHIKIGWAYDVPERLAHLQTGNAHRLVLLGVIPGGATVEGVYQRAWGANRVRGEWFKAVPRLVEYIRCYSRSWEDRHKWKVVGMGRLERVGR